MNNSLGGKCYEKQIELDYMREPITICEVEKRRKCDSFYVCENRKLRKKIKELNRIILLYKGLSDIKGGKKNENK